MPNFLPDSTDFTDADLEILGLSAGEFNGVTGDHWRLHRKNAEALAYLRDNAGGGGGAGTSTGTHDTNVTVVRTDNTVTETDIITWTAAAGTVDAGEMLRSSLACRVFNNTGSNVTFEFRFYVGATEVLTTGAMSLSASGNSRRFNAESVVVADTTSAQTTMGQAWVTNTTGASMDTIGVTRAGYGTSTIDFTGAVEMKWTVEMGTASTSAFIEHVGSGLNRFESAPLV